MNRVMQIIAISTIFIAIFAAFVSGDTNESKQQGIGAKTSINSKMLPIGYKENETGKWDLDNIEEKDNGRNETKALRNRENKTKEHELNETDSVWDKENKTKSKDINKTKDTGNIEQDHGKRGSPPGLNQSITQGNPGNVSVDVRIRNIERIKEKFQDIRVVNATKEEQPGLRIGQYVQNLEDISELIGNKGGGMKVSEIAKNIKKSLEKSKRAEEKIKGRNFIVRFIFGGDKNSAREMKDEISKNQEMIKELNDIEKNSSDDVKPLLNEHIKLLEMETGRLNSISNTEIKAFSLFGWLF